MGMTAAGWGSEEEEAVDAGYSLGAVLGLLLLQSLGSRAHRLQESWHVGSVVGAGRDWGQEEKGTTEDEMAGWHH